MIDGEERRSPVMMVFDRTEDHHVKAELAGFEKGEMHIESVPMQGPVIANCLLLLCIPQLFESERLTHFELLPGEVEINLTPRGWTPR